MVEDLNFMQLVQMPDYDTQFIQLFELQWYIAEINKKKVIL